VKTLPVRCSALFCTTIRVKFVFADPARLSALQVYVPASRGVVCITLKLEILMPTPRSYEVWFFESFPDEYKAFVDESSEVFEVDLLEPCGSSGSHWKDSDTRNPDVKPLAPLDPTGLLPFHQRICNKTGRDAWIRYCVEI